MSLNDFKIKNKWNESQRRGVTCHRPCALPKKKKKLAQNSDLLHFTIHFSHVLTSRPSTYCSSLTCVNQHLVPRSCPGSAGHRSLSEFQLLWNMPTRITHKHFQFNLGTMILSCSSILNPCLDLLFYPCFLGSLLQWVAPWSAKQPNWVILLYSLSQNPQVLLLSLNILRMNLLLSRTEMRESWRGGPMPSIPNFQEWGGLSTDPGTKLVWFKSQSRHSLAIWPWVYHLT